VHREGRGTVVAGRPDVSQILVVYPPVLRRSNGDEYEARACGHERHDARWEAWLEFRPLHRGTWIRTSPETTQLDRAALFAWAEALSRVYLEGAIERALSGASALGQPEALSTRPRSAAEPEGVIDPFEVYAHGQSLLRRHLEGLSVMHLRHIARAHDMVEKAAADSIAKEELVDLIVRETQRRAPEGAPAT
jgi:hypothetical protein